MPSIDIEVAKTTSLRAFSGYLGGTDKAYQAEFEQHLIGYSHEGDYLWGLIAFDINWAGMNIGQINKAELVLHSDNVPGEVHHHNDGGAYGRENIKLSMVTSSWQPAGSGGEENWNDELAVPKVDANYRVYGGAGRNVTEQVEFVVEVSEIVMAWAPASVKGPTGQAGKARANHGMLMQASGSVEQAKTRGWCVASKHHSTTAWAPVLRLTFASNIGPGTTVLIAPSGVIPDITGINFVGEFLSPGLGIKMTARSIEVREAVGGAAAWSSLNVAVSASESDAATFSVALPASLNSQKAYEWRARVKDSRGTWTPWTAYASFNVSTAAPTLVLVGPSGTFSTLNGVRFSAEYSDPESNRLRSLRIQVRGTTSPASPVWDTGDHFWDTGDTAARRGEIDTGIISRLYEGEALLPGGFSFRIRATDRLGGESNWVYGTFTLTKGYEPRPGGTNLLTGYGRDRYDWRIQLRAMGTNRGPGKLVAEITDAAAVGCSEFYNSPGEFYFTVPINHPQASAVEPFQTHWSLEFFRGEGWWPAAYGLITDYDATDDEVVFYGLDYLGLLSLLYDERFNEQDSADKKVEDGGSKYSNWRVSSIIKDQLTLAKATANSPVGFATVADPSDWNEFVTIFATFKERLSFISGLIESHRAGTGVRSRLVCERDISGGYTFRLLDAPGTDRDNILLEYGGLAQGFHIVPFGAFGTRVHGIGRAVDGTKPYYSRQIAPGPAAPDDLETVYGSFPQTRLWADIADLNDLKRRTKQAARNVAKVGKRLGVGLRVSSLDVKDGWDITDSIKVSIKRGVVDTTRYGSDWFTIWGWQWEWFENAPALTLSMLPREDTSAPDPDLLPSDPVIIQPQPSLPPFVPPEPCVPTGQIWPGTYVTNHSAPSPAMGPDFVIPNVAGNLSYRFKGSDIHGFSGYPAGGTGGTHMIRCVNTGAAQPQAYDFPIVPGNPATNVPFDYSGTITNGGALATLKDGTPRHFFLFNGDNRESWSITIEYGELWLTADGPADCEDPDAPVPLPGQPVKDDIVGYGDGVTMQFTTSYPYAPGSLRVFVDGQAIIAGLTELTPALGTFVLDFAPLPAIGDSRAEAVVANYVHAP